MARRRRAWNSSARRCFACMCRCPRRCTRGQYNAEVYLFRDGNVISAQSTPLFIDQTGLERRLYNFAHSSPLVLRTVSPC